MPGDVVVICDAPLIPDLLFRCFRGPRDLAGIAAIHRARMEYDQLDPLAPGQSAPTVAELAEVYRLRLDFDPARQMLMAEIRGRLVGYAWIRAWEGPDGVWVLFHRLLLAPAWRGKGIGVTMLRWAETTLAAVAEQRPSGTRAVLRCDVYSSERETVVRLEQAGYRIGHTEVEMALPSLDQLPEARPLDGIDIRAPEPDECRSAYFALYDAFVEAWNYEPKTEDDFQELMRSPANDPSLWRIALADAQIAGVIVCEAHSPAGIISELSVGQAWRRRGIGRALALAGLGALRERGLTEARVYTDAANPQGARSLYERIGFQAVKNVRSYLKQIQSLQALP